MIGVGILGAGFMGQTHAAAWSALTDRSRVISVSSRSGEKAHKVAQSCGATPTTDLWGPLTAPGVDVVDICLPTALHREAAERAFAAGKDVLLEKPIALSVVDGEAIVEAARRSGRRLSVGLVLRFWPEYRELRRIVASGELGAVRSATALRLSPQPDWNDWMRDAEQSGGVAVDLAVHDFDMLSAILGEPRRVFARALRSTAGTPEHLLAIVEHDGGEGSVEASLSQPSSYAFSSGLRVLCELGVVEYPFSAAPASDGGNIGGVDQAANRLRVYPSGGAMRLVDVEGADPWARQIDAFAGWVERGDQPDEATGEQALLALRVSLAANRSLESGRSENV